MAPLFISLCTNVPTYKAVEWMVERSRLARRITIFLDDFLGYGKPVPKDKWWFDLDWMEGHLQIPSERED